MKRILITAIILVAACLRSNAQVFILGDNVTTGRMSRIEGTVIDSLTNEAIPFASFYVIPAKDTTISNFTLTDAEGKAKLEDVPYGDYTLRVEMLGYKPFVKRKYFRDRVADMGTIKLQVDDKYLEAAVVTDVGNPIVVKKDTVEFNASSFQVGTNAMLKDLLKRMPGMEITDDGKVKFNGEAIDKLTVGGKTFFFDDQSTALNNLPATIVDKIRVIDRESERTRDTGLQDGNREKVLDVALKKEYEKGWFGNAGLKGGTTFAGGEDDPLKDDRGLLYSGNVLAAAYSEKDQVTLIGNGMNINDSNGVVFVVYGAGGDRTRISDFGAISSAAQFGANVNTSRIKNFDSTVGANYKYGDSRSGSKSFRTTFQEDGNILSSSESSSRGFSNSVSANGEFFKEKGKVRVRISPQFSYSRDNDFNNSNSNTTRDGALVNTSQSNVHALGTSKYATSFNSLNINDLWGKKNRVLGFTFDISHSDSEGETQENSLVKMRTKDESKSLKYLNDGRSSNVSGQILYGEPIGEKIIISTTARLAYNKNNSTRDAYDASGFNDYYSSESHLKGLSQSYNMTAQYKFTDKSWATLGASLNGDLSETWSKSFGIEETTGEGEWYWHVAPVLRIQHSFGNNRIGLNSSGFSQRPSQSSMLPVMNISNPARPTIGNIYLHPNGNTYFSANWHNNNREKFSTLMLTLYCNIDTRPVTYARWYDTDGILYSIPVNSRKNRVSGSVYTSYTTPLDGKARKWFLTVAIDGGIANSTSYQTKGTLPGINRETFDYSSFMESFWGDASGNRFYSGKSGFNESSTITITPSLYPSLRYTSGDFTGRINASFSKRIARYSLDPSLNMNTTDSSVGAYASYRTKHEFEFNTDLSYNWYNGYSAGYGAPEWQWNGEIAKNIKAFTLSVKIHDILDQTRNLTHTVTANYEEDTYSLVMGRYILFGLKWNFGKMNAANSQKAQNAAFRMAF